MVSEPCGVAGTRHASPWVVTTSRALWWMRLLLIALIAAHVVPCQHEKHLQMITHSHRTRFYSADLWESAILYLILTGRNYGYIQHMCTIIRGGDAFKCVYCIAFPQIYSVSSN